MMGPTGLGLTIVVLWPPMADIQLQCFFAVRLAHLKLRGYRKRVI